MKRGGARSGRRPAPGAGPFVAALALAVACRPPDITAVPGAGAAAPAAAAAADAGSGTRDADFSFGVPDGQGEVAPASVTPVKSCRVTSALDGLPNLCDRRSPAMAFEPRLKWAWSEPGRDSGASWGSRVTPLVANLTDDDGNGTVDLCDVPDVLVVTAARDPRGGAFGRMYVLGGGTGAVARELALEAPDQIAPHVTPAIGDLDGDGRPEVVTAARADGKLLVFGHDGKLKWRGTDAPAHAPADQTHCAALAIHDLDADGAPEIVYGASDVFDARGRRRFGNDARPASPYHCLTSAAADLDGDGQLEVILGNAAYRADGRLYFRVSGPPGHSAVANLDADPHPEIVLTRIDGIAVLEHDGTVKVRGGQADSACWGGPVSVHDFDGDHRADVATATCQWYGAYRPESADFPPLWRKLVTYQKESGSGTAFDFLGRGRAQAVYSDGGALHVFDGPSGDLAFRLPRSGAPLFTIEYPVVADVDDDGSADLVVVSAAGGATSAPTVQVFEDAGKRWMPTRRIWNQHAYHVTNVREDGTIPRTPARHWLGLNTFRTNAQMEGQQTCQPAVIP